MKTTNKFRTAYDKHKRYGFKTLGESLTQQSYAHDARIQNIVKKYDNTGFFDSINRNPAQYGDFTQVTDLTEAMNKIQDAKDNFMEIPSNIREQFHNNPEEFYNFASDDNNFDALVDMGLATARVPNIDSSPVVEEKASSTPPSEGGEEA